MSHTASTGSRESSLKFALIFCIIDVVLMGGAAMMSNSVTILGDVLKETTDTLSVLAAFLTIRAVRKSASHQFAYGIGKLENLVSITVGALMVGCALFITVRSVHHFSHPVKPEGTEAGIAMFAVYMCVGYFIWGRARAAVKLQPSAIMESQARLWFSKASFDAVMGSGLLVALLFRESHWSWYLDPIASLVGVLFMLHAAWGMSSSSVGDLLDATIEESIQLQIMGGLVDRIDDYERIHKVRTRRSGPNIYVEIFLEFDPMLLMGEVQRRIDGIRGELEGKIPGTDVSIRPMAPISV